VTSTSTRPGAVGGSLVAVAAALVVVRVAGSGGDLERVGHQLGGDRGGGGAGGRLGGDHAQLVALVRGVAQAEDLDAEHQRDHGAAVELEPHRVTRSPAMAAAGWRPEERHPRAGRLDVAHELQEFGDQLGGGGAVVELASTRPGARPGAVERLAGRGDGGAGDQLEALDRGARLAGAEHALYSDFVFSVGLGALFW
jgi:hypothetical protein